MKRIHLAAAIAAILTWSGAFAGDIALPADGDAYSALVAKAAAHDAGTDFRALRFSYLDSKAHGRAGAQLDKSDQLREAMFVAARAQDHAKVRSNAEQLLAIDYTDLWAHKLLSQSCIALKDEACAELHHFVEFGLLDSIMHSGDGKSCATGWEAVQIGEEYFVLAMMGIKFEQQSLVNAGGHNCDAMQGTAPKGEKVTYFFNIDAMMAAEAKQFAKP